MGRVLFVQGDSFLVLTMALILGKDIVILKGLIGLLVLPSFLPSAVAASTNPPAPELSGD